MSRLLPHQVSVETERPIFPPACVCCGGAPETEYRPNPLGRQQGMPVPDDPLAFPYCSNCLAHFESWQRHSGDRLIAANLLIWGIAIPMMSALPPYLMVIGPVLGGLFLKRRQLAAEPSMGANCSSDGIACRAIWYRRSTYVFSFANKKVAEQFRDLNLNSITAEPATA